AIARSILGDHNAALSMLESLLPAVREIARWYPADFFSHLNSLAIELGEVGRVDDANLVIDYALSTPFARNQPEWHDTKLELATKPRLVFPAFTMALGAPVEPQPLNESEALPRPFELQEPAEAESQTRTAERRPYSHHLEKSAKSQSRQCKPVVLVRRGRIEAPLATTLRARLAIRHGRGAPGLNLQPVHAGRGYTLSPPARAPPVRSRNVQACNSNN
ncbi:MAG: hypothetical protein ACREDR_20445, partial [Blastocatellia bacterium]